MRRQFKTGDNPLETQLLDYPIHQRRLLPLLAQAVAMGFTSFRMTALFEEMSEELEALGTDSDAEETKSVLEKLKETHATSAGLKVRVPPEYRARCRVIADGGSFPALPP